MSENMADARYIPGIGRSHGQYLFILETRGPADV
jgi:hypothetical protein